MAFHKVNYAKSQARVEDYVGRIEATHDSESHVSITLSALRGQQSQDHHANGAKGANFELYVMILNDVGDDVPGKLDQYLKRMTSSIYAQESSSFMRATLGMAAELSAAKNVGYHILNHRIVHKRIMPSCLQHISEILRKKANAFMAGCTVSESTGSVEGNESASR